MPGAEPKHGTRCVLSFHPCSWGRQPGVVRGAPCWCQSCLHDGEGPTRRADLQSLVVVARVVAGLVAEPVLEVCHRLLQVVPLPASAPPSSDRGNGTHLSVQPPSDLCIVSESAPAAWQAQPSGAPAELLLHLGVGLAVVVCALHMHLVDFDDGCLELVRVLDELDCLRNLALHLPVVHPPHACSQSGPNVC